MQREVLIDKSENDALLDALFGYLKHGTKYNSGTDELRSRCFTLALALTSSVLMLREGLGPLNPRIADRAKEWSELLEDIRKHLDITDKPTLSSCKSYEEVEVTKPELQPGSVDLDM